MLKKLILGIFLCIPFLLSSCASSGKTVYFDDTLPEEETATLWFAHGITLTAYNGINIDEKVSCFVIPAGDAQFVVDIEVRYGNTIFTATDAIFEYNFEAGKEYSLWFSASGEDQKGIDDWGMDLFSGAQTSMVPNSRSFITFTPFLNIEGKK
ncbi:MAG: hypothetical protein LBU99_02270 [Spirochaetaceae bacterium]|jgi:hypothetical protein|nr:hypothetical protein [Spirochaetaceae bacterium]